jgi:hypothetical protein
MSNTDTVASPTNPTDIEKSADGQPQRSIDQMSYGELGKMLDASPNSPEANAAAVELDKRQEKEIKQRQNLNKSTAEQTRFLLGQTEDTELLYRNSRGNIISESQVERSALDKTRLDVAGVREKNDTEVNTANPLTFAESNAYNSALNDVQDQIAKWPDKDKAILGISNYLEDKFPFLSKEEKIRVSTLLEKNIDSGKEDINAKIPGRNEKITA